MARKIRVLQVINQLAFGGAEALQYTFAQAIDQRRFELHVCALRHLSPDVVGQRLRQAGIPVVVLDQRSLYDLRALLRLTRYIRRHRIDIIHTHLAGADILGRIAGFLTGRPVVSTIHNLRVDVLEGPARRRWLYRWTARWFNRRLAVLNEEERASTAQWFGLPLEQVVAIANGVDVARFHAEPGFDRAAFRQELIGGDHPLVVTIARMTVHKALPDLVAAAQLVVAALPDTHFLLAGDGPVREQLEAQVRELGLEASVHFAGFRDDVPHLLKAGDLFVLSSVTEGMPLVVLEAMAAGTPVVATEVGGIPTIIHDGVTGLLVPPSRPEELAAAILADLRDPERAQRMALAAKGHVIERYGMRAWARRWEELYMRELGLARDPAGQAEPVSL